MRVLIAGCGDLGLAVATRLLAAGYCVSGLRRSWPQTLVLPRGLAQLTGDLAARDAVLGLVDGFDQVVYCPTPAARTVAAYQTVFVDGLNNLLGGDHRRQPPRVVFVSSTAVYGQTDGSWVDERAACKPPRFNGQILLAAERVLEASGVEPVALRLGGIYGPGRTGLLRRVRGAGPCRRDYWTNRIHRDDAAAAIVHLLQLSDPASCYIGVDDAPSPECAVMDWLAEALGVAPVVVQESAESRNKRCSNARLRASGFQLAYPDFKSGYASLLAADQAQEGQSRNDSQPGNP